MDFYAVLGNPIHHSLSPEIHSQFAKQTNQHLQYAALEVPKEDFAAFVKGLHEADYQGMNITLPFKLEAWELSESRTERAESAGAVNTLIRTDNGWRGDNTDGAGLVTDLTKNLGLQLKDKRILILGAGGATRGVLYPLLAEQPESIHIANRTAAKAATLADDFKSAENIRHSGLDGPFHAPYDIIINATAASLSGQVPKIPAGLLAKNGACYDMMYASEPTAFEQWAKTQGAKVISGGLGMLVEQAAESFEQWRGVRPDTASVLANLSA
jgi:shikimate dehydrogenase